MTPVASVVIPALNEAETIGAQLSALAAQDFHRSWEVIVVDNGSTDDTVAVCRSYETVLTLRVESCARPGTGPARNAGAATARGGLLLFCDADDEVAPGWVSAMVAALGHTDAVGGKVENDRLNHSRPAHLPRHPEGLPVVAGFLPRTLTANLGVRRRVFQHLGGFAEEYGYGSDDTEFCWRLQLAGFELDYAPEAVVHYRHRSELRSAAVKSYRAHYSRGRLFRDYGPQGMPRPKLAGALVRWGRLVLSAPAALFSPRVRWWWVEQAAAAAGRIAGSVAFRVRYL